jgi:hypothetical protein
MMMISSRGPRLPAVARKRPSGDQLACELMKRKVS